MKTNMSSTGSKTDSTESEKITSGYVDPAAAPKVDEVETHDDLGYEIVKTDDKTVVPPKADDKVVPPKEDDKPVEKAVTGYGKEEEIVPPKADDKPVEKKPEEMNDEEKAQKEIAETIKELGPGYNKEKISKFAIEHKLTKAQLDAYVKLTKEEDSEFVKAQETARVTQRKAWNQELMSDPEFGGENFDKNVDRVEKVLQNHMTNTKKVLTEKGSMLPPYIMRDLLGLAKLINPTTKLVNGEAPAPKEDEGNFLDDLYK